MKHLLLKYYNVYINHDPVMTLTQFMARSTWVDHVFKWGKLLKCHLKGKASRKLANGQNIDYSENKEENGPRASSAPTLGLNTILLYPPQNEVLGGYTVFSLSVIPSFRHSVNILTSLLNNLSSFCPMFFKFSTHWHHKTTHV